MWAASFLVLMVASPEDWRGLEVFVEGWAKRAWLDSSDLELIVLVFMEPFRWTARAAVPVAGDHPLENHLKIAPKKKKT